MIHGAREMRAEPVQLCEHNCDASKGILPYQQLVAELIRGISWPQTSEQNKSIFLQHFAAHGECGLAAVREYRFKSNFSCPPRAPTYGIPVQSLIIGSLKPAKRRFLPTRACYLTAGAQKLRGLFDNPPNRISRTLHNIMLDVTMRGTRRSAPNPSLLFCGGVVTCPKSLVRQSFRLSLFATLSVSTFWLPISYSIFTRQPFCFQAQPLSPSLTY
jgi:hypothetical protein